MWNFSYNFGVTDDVTQQFHQTFVGTVEQNAPMRVERAMILDKYRKIQFVGRLMVDPKPELPNPEGVRFKERVGPILEPYDLKGLGALFFRYLHPSKADDSWVYIPQLRRVRRLSTAQRSDALFGQDTDSDSYWGYNGHIAWMDYRLVGEQTILVTMHARNFPPAWQEPEDWLWDDVWEPRQMWVVEAVSKVPQYAFSKRVLFIDKEGYICMLNDSYDRAGQLWKTSAQQYAVRKAQFPGAQLARYEDAWPFERAVIIWDSQLQHATSTSMPGKDTVGEEGFILNRGEQSGVTLEWFTVASMIESGS
jgi:hypothetical protein